MPYLFMYKKCYIDNLQYITNLQFYNKGDMKPSNQLQNSNGFQFDLQYIYA